MVKQRLTFLFEPKPLKLWNGISTSSFNLPSTLSPSISFHGTSGGSELSLCGAVVGRPSVVKKWVVATGDAPWTAAERCCCSNGGQRKV